MVLAIASVANSPAISSWVGPFENEEKALARALMGLWREVVGDQLEQRASALRRVDGQSESLYFHITDGQFSTVAMLDESAVLRERVSYLLGVRQGDPPLAGGLG
jgi:hypothetical protein